ncbi:A24 family peptidase [uncultured Thiodictyon sp.]|uniref:prepilin peptidase n=1 Tax=uncultured Thiodictyon sp. TaxID=1846217 RepID=UPI0025F9C09C|nr:A24 family peptidase [uncultured Thiodictyon sp.]
MPWIEIFAQNPPLLYGSALALGLIIGSFLNVVILRLPRIMEAGWRRECAELSGSATDGDSPALSLAQPPSQCPACGHRIRALENVPILSYLFLRGRCSACGVHIGLRYPLIEGLTALLTLMVVLHFGLTWQALAALPLTWALIALAFIDYDTQLLPDSITIPLLWVGLLLSLFGLFTDPRSAIIGAAAGYLSLWSVFQLFRLATGKEGMGYGDFKLLALFGAWFGWQLLLQIILLSAVTGALLGTLLIVTGRHGRGVPMPFGPFLAVAGWVCLIWGQPINDAYLRISGLS